MACKDAEILVAHLGCEARQESMRSTGGSAYFVELEKMTSYLSRDNIKNKILFDRNRFYLIYGFLSFQEIINGPGIHGLSRRVYCLKKDGELRSVQVVLNPRGGLK
jgi:hypothetical protein